MVAVVVMDGVGGWSDDRGLKMVVVEVMGWGWSDNRRLKMMVVEVMGWGGLVR